MIGVRLKTISDPNRLAFDPLNNFTIKVNSVEAIRSNQSRVVIYADPMAIVRTSSSYNTLDARARDSNLVIGLGYVPPDDYIGINLLIDPGQYVVRYGYQQIRVDKPENFTNTLEFRKSFTVKESQTTQIVLTINLDSTLVQGNTDFVFVPYYYISSIH